MSPWNLEQKLRPAKKAWKSFKSKLQSNIQSLKLPKTIKTTTHRLLALRFFRFFIPSKLRTLTKPSSTSRLNHYHQHLHHYDQNPQALHKGFAAIHIDELFAKEEETRKGKHVQHGDGKLVATRRKSSLYSVEDAWQAVVASSPQLLGVDERAEQFICKFREDMKLQKERSILEYQEMLARSA
ncbi:uncharacterized protein LOC107422873 [Ziziphus jujuba]|uniref:Uncharacterized protein LOC107422873 n=2 Tax=Ziziphus jujuba TaxID=326968 RepID=A0A6P4AH84_ZIZJJ|nr:uncharacterized protein LOC107422873 [Ziziphus jujuba]KAH7522088.1 hypothetical protein FEM48_Zijuj07G0100700 [Ziziphus jujuba var. spinosa]